MTGDRLLQPHGGSSSVGIIERALPRDTGHPRSAAGVRTRRAGRRAAPPRVDMRLIDVDPELGEAVPPPVRDRARHRLRAAVSHHAPGPVTLPEPVPTAFALLIVAGAGTAEVRLTPGARMLELLLPGDIVPPRPVSVCLPDHQVTLTALPSGLSLATLDHRFLQAATMWPGLMTTIHRRLHDQTHRVAVHSAICQLPRIQDRVIAILSHLAGRIGKVTPAGIVVPLALRHEDLARYVGACRPSVSQAIKMLRAQGRLDRRADGMWLLPSSAMPEFDPAQRAAGRHAPPRER